MGPSEFFRTVQVYYSWRRLLRRGLKFYVRTINKGAPCEKSLEIYLRSLYIYIYIYIYIYMCVCVCVCVYTL